MKNIQVTHEFDRYEIWVDENFWSTAEDEEELEYLLRGDRHEN